MADILEGLSQEDVTKLTQLLRETGSNNKDVAIAAQRAFAAALQAPLRQGILSGDTVAGIYRVDKFDPNARIEYPIDFYRPDNASEFTAYVIPNQGRLPERTVSGDYLSVPVYDIGNAIDWLLRYAQEARWDVVARGLEVLEAGFVKKLNDDGWHTLLAAAFDRNIVVSDANASAGQFTKRLISLMKLVMRRNAGGNSTSLNRGKLTDLYISPEAAEDIRNWGIDQLDEITRREVFVATDDGKTKIYDVNINSMDELGEGQEYQTYYTSVIAAAASNSGMASATDVEIVIGLDLSKNDSFVMPVREELQVFEDETLHRARRQGYYSWRSQGFGVLNNVRTLLASC